MVEKGVSEGRPVCDYEGYAYRSEFWGEERAYEDGVERIALRRLLPPSGRRIVDIGGGYGRLIPLYQGYQEVVIFDYALSQLREARERWGDAEPGGCPRYIYVAGDFYHLPFVPGLFDTVCMVRTLHHAAEAPVVLQGVSQILAPSGDFVLEFANKRNLKAIVRYLLGRQGWSPFEREPVEFLDLHFDFHPRWIRQQLREVELTVQQQRTVSHFRLGLLKRTIPTNLLVALDRILQPTGAVVQLSPSVFVRSQADEDKASAREGAFFRCVRCGAAAPGEAIDGLRCAQCGCVFPIRDGIYDFKTPLEDRG